MLFLNFEKVVKPRDASIYYTIQHFCQARKYFNARQEPCFFRAPHASRGLFAAPLAFAIATMPATAAEPATPISPHHLSGGAQLHSEYLVRGLSLSWHQPSPMVYLDYSHDSGWYAGGWLAGVNTRVYNEGHWEMGGYGGYAGNLSEKLGWNVGAIGYFYPNAESSPLYSIPTRYNTAEAYASLSYGVFMVKYWHTLTSYWGVTSKNPWCWDTGCTPANGSSHGSQYLEVNLTYPLPGGVTLGLHAAHQWIAHYDQLNYSDYRATLDKSWGPWTGTLGYSATNAPKEIYTYTSRNETENIAKDVWFVRLGRTF